MKKFISVILFTFYSISNFGQDFQIPKTPTQDLNRGGNLQNSVIGDSLLNRFGNKSTMLNKNPDAKIEDYLIISKKYDTTTVDTSLTINKYYKNNFLRKDNFELIPFSNTGIAYNNLTFQPNMSLNPKMGASNKYLMYEMPSDIVYYHLPTPFTELMYRSVFEQGQLLDATYSVNTSRQFNFSISRKGLRSLGNYQNFLSNSSNFKFTTNYMSKNKKLKVRTHYSNQKLFAEQNGGINNSDIESFENGNSQFLDRGVFDPNFENAHNEFIGKRFYFDQSYILKKRDSIEHSNLELLSSFYFEEKKYKFQQNSSDTFFGNFYENHEINDKIFLNIIDLEAKLKYDSDSLGKLILGLNFRSDEYFLQNFEIDQHLNDNKKLSSKTTFINANYHKKFNSFDLSLKTKNYLLGDYKSNYLSAGIRFDLKNESFLDFDYKFSSSKPNYNYILYTSNYENYNWNNEFDNILSSTFNLKLRLNKSFFVDAELISVRNHAQFEKQAYENSNNETFYRIVPIQHSGNLDIVKIGFKRSLIFGKFSIDTRVLFQKSISDDILNIPDLISRNTIFYSTDLFNKALYLQTGFGIKFFSKYYMNSYDPLLSEFYIQRDKKIGEFPLVDFFVNAKIQQTRLYFKLEHFNSSFTGYNYYSAPNYPYRDFNFRFGLVWNFFQ